MTHAYFKGLLFLAAGSVIHAVMADQDIRRMGQLRGYMPITYITMLIGALALAGIPPFAGFWSKDLIIEAAAVRGMGWVSGFAYWALVSGAFFTAFYTFRMFFLTFHNSDRVPAKTKAHLHESPKVITVPLIILAIGALLSGWWGEEILNIPGEGGEGYFGSSIFVLPRHDPLATLEEMERAHATGIWLETGALIMALAGIALAWLMYFKPSDLPARLASRYPALHRFLLDKWRFDELYWRIFVLPARAIGSWLWQKADLAIIDRGVIHGGIIDNIARAAERLRRIQSGMVYHYAYAMVIGLFGLLTWMMVGD